MLSLPIFSRLPVCQQTGQLTGQFSCVSSAQAEQTLPDQPFELVASTPAQRAKRGETGCTLVRQPWRNHSRHVVCVTDLLTSCRSARHAGQPPVTPSKPGHPRRLIFSPNIYIDSEYSKFHLSSLGLRNMLSSGYRRAIIVPIDTDGSLPHSWKGTRWRL